MREIIPKINNEEQKTAFKEGIRKKLEKELPSIKISDLDLDTSTLESIYHFHPYFTDCEKLFPLTEKTIQEISSPDKRLLIMQQSVQVAQRIVKTLFSEERKPGKPEDTILHGKCGVASGITQELMALSGVRSVIVHGTFDTKQTKRYKEDIIKTQTQNHLYGHHWLYASKNNIVPTSASDLINKLSLIDPTRSQFEQNKQPVVELADKRYIPFNIPSNADSTFINKAKDSFTQMNKTIWTEEELDQWRIILTKFY